MPNKTTQPLVRPLFLVALGLAVVWASVMVFIRDNQSVLGEQTDRLQPPQNIRAVQYICKDGHAWAYLKWDTAAGANAYRIKFWRTSGELLHSQETDISAVKTEMYQEFDTDISVQSLKRESAEGEAKVVTDSDDSEKFRLAVSQFENVCSPVSGEDNKPKPTKKPESAKNPEVTKMPEPSKKTESSVVKEDKPVSTPGFGSKSEDVKVEELESKIEKLEQQNRELQVKQNSLELMVQNLFTTIRNIFRMGL